MAKDQKPGRRDARKPKPVKAAGPTNPFAGAVKPPSAAKGDDKDKG